MVVAGKHMAVNHSQLGFTLVEVLITTFIIGIVSTSIYSVFRIHNLMAAKQEETTHMQQELLAIVGEIANDLRMCGFSPNSGNFGFSNRPNIGSPDYGRAVNATTIYCTTDADGDGSLDGNNASEHIGFALNISDTGAALITPDNILRKYASDSSATKWQPAATNIASLRFTYFDAAGSVINNPSANLGNIRSVEINATATPSPERANLSIGNRTMVTRVWCRNLGL